MNIEQLAESNFKEFPIGPIRPTANRNWQYCRRSVGLNAKQFFVQITQYKGGTYEGWCADAQLTDEKGNTFNVELLDVTNKTPQEVSDWFYLLWLKLYCKNYGE